MNSWRSDRLREWREKRGLKQRELARLCGIAVNLINKYENEGGDPSISTLRAIARELRVSADYLLGLSDEPFSPMEDTLLPEHKKLIEAYDAGDSSAVVALLYRRLEKLARVPD